jgi:hypothetical protein
LPDFFHGQNLKKFLQRGSGKKFFVNFCGTPAGKNPG